MLFLRIDSPVDTSPLTSMIISNGNLIFHRNDSEMYINFYLELQW